MKELNEMEMADIHGGGEWTAIGMLWTAGGGAFAVVAGVAAAFTVAPVIVGVAIIAGAAFAASGALVLVAEANAPRDLST